jgi:hypothetical protein
MRKFRKYRDTTGTNNIFIEDACLKCILCKYFEIVFKNTYTKAPFSFTIVDIYSQKAHPICRIELELELFVYGIAIMTEMGTAASHFVEVNLTSADINQTPLQIHIRQNSFSHFQQK